jgi:hypothetical protein
LIQKGLGPVSAITTHEGSLYVATNDGVNILHMDPSNGLTLDQFPLVRILHNLFLTFIGKILMSLDVAFCVL